MYVFALLFARAQNDAQLFAGGNKFCAFVVQTRQRNNGRRLGQWCFVINEVPDVGAFGAVDNQFFAIRHKDVP